MFHNDSGALDISDFFFVNSAGVDAAVHIGNIGPDGCEGSECVPGDTGTGSVFAGEKPGAVPEPGTLMLLGAGLVSVGVARRVVSRRRK